MDPSGPSASTGRWSVAVFTSREDAAVLERTLAAVAAACGSRDATIDVLVDGNSATAEAVASSKAALGERSTMRLWLLPWRDKACAWNRWVYEIAPPADVAFCVDGYVRPRADSFDRLAHGLDARPDAWAAAALPTAGRSAAALRAQMQAEGGIHGNLYALRGTALETLRARDFRIPLGLYRNDSLIGAVVAFGADPASEPWTPSRVVPVAAATWDLDEPPPGLERLRAAVKRRARQAQGDLENAAVRRHLALRRQPVGSLPRTVQALVAADGGALPGGGGWLTRALRRKALVRLAEPADWTRCEAPPRLLRTWGQP